MKVNLCALLLSAFACSHAFAVELRVATYNVAGLPDFVSQSNPKKNSPLISPLLNDFDIVLLQEDFNYHKKLISQAVHPFKSKHKGLAGFGDGLNRLSSIPFSSFKRDKWDDCHGVFSKGSDCLTPKGWSFARHHIEGVGDIDVYNMHADAGSDEKSIQARASNLRELANAIEARSHGMAVIVAGDFNSRYTRQSDVMEVFNTLGLQDAWIQLKRGGLIPEKGSSLISACSTEPDSGDCELIDKILFRSGDKISIELADYLVPKDQFQTPEGADLSDHLPVTAAFNIY